MNKAVKFATQARVLGFELIGMAEARRAELGLAPEHSSTRSTAGGPSTW